MRIIDERYIVRRFADDKGQIAHLAKVGHFETTIRSEQSVTQTTQGYSEICDYQETDYYLCIYTNRVDLVGEKIPPCVSGNVTNIILYRLYNVTIYTRLFSGSFSLVEHIGSIIIDMHIYRGYVCFYISRLLDCARASD